MISPVFSIGASVASLKCEVSGVSGVVWCGVAIIKVLIYCLGSDYPRWLLPTPQFSVLDQATMQARPPVRLIYFYKLNDHLQSSTFLFNNNNKQIWPSC